jgi:predicted DNA-binding transcriptional regulator AlpA
VGKKSPATIYSWLKVGGKYHAPTFPRPLKTPPGYTNRWQPDAIDAWIKSLPKRGKAKVDPADLAESVPYVPGSPSPNRWSEHEQIEIRAAQVARIREILDRQARRGTRVFYEDIMEKVGLWQDGPLARVQMDWILEQASRHSHAEHKVLIGVLVHERAPRKGLPSESFFSLAESLGYQVGSHDSFVDQEIKRIFNIYSPAPVGIEGEQELRWAEFRGRPFLMRFRRSVKNESAMPDVVGKPPPEKT